MCRQIENLIYLNGTGWPRKKREKDRGKKKSAERRRDEIVESSSLSLPSLFPGNDLGERLMNDIFPMYQQHVQGFKWILETIRNRPCPNHRDEGLRGSRAVNGRLGN